MIKTTKALNKKSKSSLRFAKQFKTKPEFF